MKLNTLRNAGIAATLFAGMGALTVNASAQIHRVERHPALRQVMRQLNSSIHILSRADDDFGGHKAKAMELLRQAQAQLRLAVRSDRH